ncbi:hypothetical protein D3C76_316350 [compost metagenome]
MKCARCNIDLIRIEYPVTSCTSPTGRRLPRTVDRCPCCGLEWQDRPIFDEQEFSLFVESRGYGENSVFAPIPDDDDLPMEQLEMFESIVGGFK